MKLQRSPSKIGERQQGGDKLPLAFEGDFDVLQRLPVGDGALEQGGQRQQLRQRFAPLCCSSSFSRPAARWLMYCR